MTNPAQYSSAQPAEVDTPALPCYNPA